MNERSLPQRLSTSIVDALRARGHIAVVRGGAAALARVLEEHLDGDIDAIVTTLEPSQGIDGEVTDTIDDQGTVDQRVHTLIQALTQALLSSEHVEDAFADEAQVSQEILRALREGLGASPRTSDAAEEGPARLRLDTLGYLASMVAHRAPARALRAALDRAAQGVGCKLNAYDPELREATFSLSEATFSLTVADPEARLDLEQAVLDELTDLVNANLVTLPAHEHEVQLGAPVPAALLATLKPRIDAAAARILRRGGCTATWELRDGHRLWVAITPMSDTDATDVSQRATLLRADIEALLRAAEHQAEPLPTAPREKPARDKKTNAGKTAPETPPRPATSRSARTTPSPKASSPKASSPKASSSKTAVRKTSPKASSSKTAAPKASPKDTTRKSSSAKAATQKAGATARKAATTRAPGKRASRAPKG
ncbi:hypothetical protein [Chondromyces apiculatus]|uniref:Uncharacterized protein n=1 Tax=Chondromyces apiculatus DSM 436 TaxID=1192034 RepID=A0A017T8E1_9BACT|nr:hypothetical protein [Chondromyces apiculatus]EYF05523.1 Hypothetical protein CAP_3071 [Chondromyces apiculatus DSM 436]